MKTASYSQDDNGGHVSLWSALKSIWGPVQRVLTDDSRKEILTLFFPKSMSIK